MKRLLHIRFSGRNNLDRISALTLFLILGITLSGQKPYTIITEKWVNGNWQNTNRITNSYDGNNYLIGDLTQNWDELSTSWVILFQSIYTNNPNGTVSEQLSQSWNGLTLQWNNLMRKTYTYNSSNKVLTIVTEQWLGGGWVNPTRITKTYDNNGYLINELSEAWDVNTWVNSTQSIYTNNLNGTVNQVTSQLWDGISSWINTSRNTLTYNGSGKVLTDLKETWLLSWQNNILTTNTWDVNGYLTAETDQTWDNLSTTWTDGSRSDYTNDTDGKPLQIVSQSKDTESGTWINTDRITFSYSVPTDIPGSGYVNAESFIIYPNPAKDRLNIRANIDPGLTYFSIEAQNGRSLLSGKLSDTETSIDLTGLPNGVYILRLRNNEHYVYKFIKY